MKHVGKCIVSFTQYFNDIINKILLFILKLRYYYNIMYMIPVEGLNNRNVINYKN